MYSPIKTDKMQTYDDHTPAYCSKIEDIIEELEYGNLIVAIGMLKKLKQKIESDAE